MQKHLDMFENILASRKVRDVHILQGSLRWQQTEQPGQLIITLFNKRGRQISQAEVPIVKK